MIPLASFDTETTGTDVETDRIVSAALVVLDDTGQVVVSREWLINPGIPIPAEATAVHGITDEQAAEGLEPAMALDDIAACMSLHLLATAPLVVYNAPFDLTLLDREGRRHLGQPLNVPPLVVDPLVIDKHVDRYRKGKRTLTAVAEFHGIAFDGDAHGALADATAAGRLAQKLLSYPALAGATLEQLHEAQAGWARSAADSFADYLRRQGNHEGAATVDGAWPMRALP